MLTKETAFEKIKELVNRFAEQVESYKKTDYNETLARRDFIDPFFKALGWDIDNSQGYAEAYREVIHEDKIKIAGATKAPDYSFRLPGGKRLFFVEAKKPSVAVKDEVMPAYQVRRYAWSAKMPVSILTDFEELAIYDCHKKPNVTDKASVGRIKYLTYKDYLNEFDFLWETFSKEKVLKGSFDKFIAADKHKKGTATVDKEFLASLDEWRKLLALNIALRNETLTEDELNYTIQQTLDRIIFLRIAEDRGVEEYGRMKNLLKGEDYYQNLYSYFKEADEKYNSGLFDFKKDKLSSKIVIDNKTIKGIISELYYPASPYEFSVLSVEILGSAYEQFLGKQIKLTAGHRAVIEEKPEVRKAGGVYYTPQYIVEYIVENTVGKLCAGKTPDQVAKLKIVDPACGSGSFLLGAYQYLLNWHLNHYMPDFEKHTLVAQNSKEFNEKQRNEAIKLRNKLPLTPDGNLTTALKKQILLNNIYGVDIDTQAVEVTKLSLLLKCMEGETSSSITAEMRFGERLLPTLDSNIKCGNSLVDIDFYDGQFDLEPEAEKKIKPFNWQKAFPEVFKTGGFDSVIGNPPYVLGRETFEDKVKKYLASCYKSYGGKFDLYIFFCEKGLKLLKNRGRFGFIIPNTVLANENASNLRSHLLQNYSLERVRIFKNRVFENAQVETVILIISNSKPEINATTEIDNDGNIQEIRRTKFQGNKNQKINVSNDEHSEAILEKLEQQSTHLGELTDICIGIQLGGSHGSSTKEDFLSNHPKTSSWKKVLDGKNINSYQILPTSTFVHYGDWLHRKRDEKYFLNPKILIRQIGRTPVATYDEDSFYTLNTLYNVITTSDYNLKFILAIINSKLGKWFWMKKNSDFKTLFPKIKKSEIESIPVKQINPENIYGQSLYKEIVKLVDIMLQLQKEKQAATLPQQIQQIEQRINHTDNSINQKVYTLYGLTEEEIKIIEGN